MSEPEFRPPSGAPDTVERLLRAGFGAVIGRLEQLSARVQHLEGEVASLRSAGANPNSRGPHEDPSRAADPTPSTATDSVTTANSVVPAPGPSAPRDAGVVEPTGPEPRVRHIDETLVWGPSKGGRRVPGENRSPESD